MKNPSRTDLSTSLSSKLRVSLNGAADPEVHPREPALDEDGSRAEEFFSDGASGEQVDSPPSQPRNRYARQPITDLSTGGEDGARSWATFGQPSTAGAVPNAEGDVGESAETPPLSARASTEVTSRDRILPNRLATSDVADKSRSETSDPAGGRAAGKRGAGRSDDSSGRSFGRSFARMGSSSTSRGGRALSCASGSLGRLHPCLERHHRCRLPGGGRALTPNGKRRKNDGLGTDCYTDQPGGRERAQAAVRVGGESGRMT